MNKMLIEHRYNVEKNDDMAKNEKFCLLHSISQEPYII